MSGEEASMEEILDKINLLADRDTKLLVFGASVHRYILNDPISIDKLKEIERKFNCKFPADYKQFLTALGNGGAGPYYGLFPVEMHDDSHDMCRWENGFLIGSLSDQFQHASNWNLPDSFWENEPDPDSCESVEEEDALWEEWGKQLELNYWAPHIMNGAIPICHQGCAIRTWLVVTGPMSGTVWDDYRCENEGIVPLLKEDGSNMSFSDWYINWLNNSLAAAGRA